MPHNESNQLIEEFTRFRQELYNCFDSRQDTVMDLLDALASNQQARSTVELSLNPLFRRDYSALYKAIEEAFSHREADPEPDNSGGEQQFKHLLEAIAFVVPEPTERPFQLLGVDVTPMPRPYAGTLEDRTFIYQPNPIRGNKPINIGHPYSILSVLPEKVDSHCAPWVIPLSGVRVDSSQKGQEVGSALARLPAQSLGFRPREPVLRVSGRGATRS